MRNGPPGNEHLYETSTRLVTAPRPGLTRGAPKGLWPAVTNVERIGGLRLRVYLHYDADTQVSDLITAFHSRWWDSVGAQLRRLDDCLPDTTDAIQSLADRVGDVATAAAYVSGLRNLAASVGLHRIPAVGSGVIQVGYLPSGVAQVHRFLWHLDKALLWERAPQGLKRGIGRIERPSFFKLASFATPVPQIDTRIHGSGTNWDPRQETLAEARARLRRDTVLSLSAIEAELHRIASEGGYSFPDTSTIRGGIYRLDRDAQWVWWRIRHGWTYTRVAAEWTRMHPGDIRLQGPRDDLDARAWEREHPSERPSPDARDAAPHVRRAVTAFALKAVLDVQTGPGRKRPSALR